MIRHGPAAHYFRMLPRLPGLALLVATLAASPLAAAAQAISARGAERLDTALLHAAYARAAELPRLRSLLVSWRGELVGERYFRGATPSTPANIKSVSKSIISALVGIAIAEGRIRGVRQTIGELLPEATRGLDARKRAITVEDLLTMRAGLESTSFGNYGAWVSSRNWVRDALRRPMVAEPEAERAREDAVGVAVRARPGDPREDGREEVRAAGAVDHRPARLRLERPAEGVAHPVSARHPRAVVPEARALQPGAHR